MEIKVDPSNLRIVPIDSIIPDPKNTNSHPEDQINMLVEQFKIQGFRDSLIIDEEDGLLVCGEGRLIAAKKAGFKELPVIFQRFDSYAHKAAFLTAQNASQRWSSIDLAKVNDIAIDLGPDFDVDWFALKNFEIEPMDRMVGDPETKPTKYLLEVTLENEMDAQDLHDDLAFKGYSVKIKKKK